MEIMNSAIIKLAVLVIFIGIVVASPASIQVAGKLVKGPGVSASTQPPSVCLIENGTTIHPNDPGSGGGGAGVF